MKCLIPMLAVLCFTVCGVGCKSTCCGKCGGDHGHSHAEKKCCGTDGKCCKKAE